MASREELQTLSLVVAVPTYRRPGRLRAALEQILAQGVALSTDRALGVSVSVLVIDNDPAGSARAIVDDLTERGIRYSHESTPGVSAARNRALDDADGADLLVFIDDDEEPSPGWLASLVRTWRETRPAAVMGRVYFQLESTADPWVAAGGFFDRPRRPTGTELAVGAAGNLLLDLGQVGELGVRFDPRLGLSGGEDNLFTRQIVRRGGRLVWCDESVAVDFVPAERTTREWVLKRAWRTGNTTAIVNLYIADGAVERTVARLAAAARGVARVAGGALRYAVGASIRSARHEARGLRTLRRGQGMLAGARGARFEEYARTDTSTTQ
jgi:glycosyltransferase involved in cell wall biosynthesis